MSHCYNWAKCRAHWSDHWYSTWLKWNKSRPGLWQTAATIFRKKSEETNNPSRNQPIRNYLCCAPLGRGEKGPATCRARGWSRQWYWQDQAGGRTWDLWQHSSPVTAISFLSSMEGDLSTGWTGWGRRPHWRTILANCLSSDGKSWCCVISNVQMTVMSWSLLWEALGGDPGTWTRDTRSQWDSYKVISRVSPSLPPFQPDKPYKPDSQNTNWHRLTPTDIFIPNMWSPGWPLGELELEVCSGRVKTWGMVMVTITSPHWDHTGIVRVLKHYPWHRSHFVKNLLLASDGWY